MEYSPIVKQSDEAADSSSSRKREILRKLRIAGLAVLVVFVALPFIAVGAVYLCWDDIDKSIRATAAGAEVIEAADLEGHALDLLQRKMKALSTTLESEPFFAISAQEINSEINYLVNIGSFPSALPVCRVETQGDLLRVRFLWTGAQAAPLMAAWGLAPTSSIWGPVEQYVQTLPYMQLDVWVRPGTERGYFTWTIDHCLLDGKWCPNDVGEWVQDHLLTRGPYLILGPNNRALKEARVTPQGLMLKWSPPAR